jgi:hypothetical protein
MGRQAATTQAFECLTAAVAPAQELLPQIKLRALIAV